jgi:hypothetical protein
MAKGTRVVVLSSSAIMYLANLPLRLLEVVVSIVCSKRISRLYRSAFASHSVTLAVD